jgi:hypothetical protein
MTHIPGLEMAQLVTALCWNGKESRTRLGLKRSQTLFPRENGPGGEAKEPH